MIILTKEQADQVRGTTITGHALEPFPLADGTFILPEECAGDPAHGWHGELLKTLPRREVDPGEFELESPDEAVATDLGSRQSR